MEPWQSGRKREINYTDVISIGDSVVMRLEGNKRPLKQCGCRDSIVATRVLTECSRGGPCCNSQSPEGCLHKRTAGK